MQRLHKLLFLHTLKEVRSILLLMFINITLGTFYIPWDLFNIFLGPKIIPSTFNFLHVTVRIQIKHP